MVSSTCGGDRSRAPGAPEPADTASVVKLTRSAFDVPPNRAPVMNLKTNPPTDDSTRPFPTIVGSAPLLVRFNVCQSSDPDQNADQPQQGDSLNWQFNFGDGPMPAFDPDGGFNADYERFCRIEHRYDVGRYTATVSVTDKHLSDQSTGVRAMSRVTQQLTIVALGTPPPTECAFTALASSAWQATGSDIPSLATCTCPSSGTTLSAVGAYLDGCRASGFSIIVWTSGGGKCGCQ